METIHRTTETIPESLDGDSFETTPLPEIEETPFEYKILKGHFEPDRETWISDEKLRVEYLKLTDNLVQEMLKEKEIVNPETGETEMRRPSVVVFLDKSARPLSHMVRAMWPTFAKDLKTGEVPPMPRFNFLNIDREQWTNTSDERGLGRVDVDKISPGIIRNLRATSLTATGKEHVIADGVTEAVDTMPASLDNESILVVDETKSTGRTLRIAKGMIQRAFPTANVEGTYWMNKTFRSEDGSEYNGVPNWYSEVELRGRGVGDRFAGYTKYQRLGELSGENYYRAVGNLFLSAPLPDKDEDYYQVIREFKELATSPDVPVMPGRLKYRDGSSEEDRIIAYNYKDIDPSQLTETEKEELCDNIFDRIRKSNAASDEEGAEMRIKRHLQKRRK